ncbi:MAG TPA: type II toxin-antitoxin system prevent-host-death family antitoxin [Polyangiaceae bacterium]|jgi:prevent-host-death family protein
MTAARFRAECLQVLDTVASAGTEVVVTKRGKPVARIVPIGDPPAVRYGALRRITKIVDADDDLLSVNETWPVE